MNGGSRAGEVLRAATVPCGMLAFAALAVAVTALSRKRLVWAGGFGMFAESAVAFTIAPLTLAAGLVFLLIAGRAGRP